MENVRVLELLNLVLYSEEMKTLHQTCSPIKGFLDAGTAARTVQRMAGYAAHNSHLNAEYCELLTLLSFFESNTFPFLAENPELLRDVEAVKRSSQGSAEVRCAALTRKTVAEIRALPSRELEARGGWTIAVCAAVDALLIH